MNAKQLYKIIRTGSKVAPCHSKKSSQQKIEKD